MTENGAELNPDLPAVGDNELTFAELTGDEQNAYAQPADHAIAVDDFGTTEEEEATGESLDGRLARELPDPNDSGYGQASTVNLDNERGPSDELPDYDPGEGDPGEGDLTGNSLAEYGDDDDLLVGRLVEPDEGARGDVTAETLATDYGSDGGGFAAEESAMHLDPDS